MNDVVTWLKAQIDDDERIAQATNSQPGRRYSWEVRERSPRELPEIYLKGEHYRVVDELDDESAAHIVRHDPARVLREVKAKRRIITEWEEAHRMAEADPSDTSARVARFSFALAIQALYGVYSDRPGWIEGLSL